MSGPAWLAAIVAPTLAVLGWCALAEWRDRRKAREQAEWTAHVSQAVALVEVPQCEAIADRRPRPASPVRCAHLKPGGTNYASRDLGGEPVQVCGKCWVVLSEAMQRINGMAQAGVPAGWGRS